MTREELVQYAVEYTSFYAEKYAGANLQDGKSLPILTKEEAAHAGVSIISREYYTKLGTPEVKSAYTSGSTGISLEAFSTNAESAGQLFSLWLYRRKYYGINTDSKFCFFFTLRDHYEQSMTNRRIIWAFPKNCCNGKSWMRSLAGSMLFNRSGCCYSQALP